MLIGDCIYGNEIDTMAFYRDFTYCFSFFILGRITFKLYNKGKKLGTITFNN